MEEKKSVSRQHMQIQPWLPGTTFRSGFQKIQNGGKDMKGKHPKRRRDKYNPYQIFEMDGRYYISFKDGQGILREIEINESLYKAFDEFELKDLSYLNEWDRHLEHSEVYESTLNERAFYQPEDLEETVINKMQIEQLHKAVSELPEPHRRRCIWYYFFDMTLEQIAQLENRSKAAVKYSVDKALEYLKKI